MKGEDVASLIRVAALSMKEPKERQKEVESLGYLGSNSNIKD